MRFYSSIILFGSLFFFVMMLGCKENGNFMTCKEGNPYCHFCAVSPKSEFGYKCYRPIHQNSPICENPDSKLNLSDIELFDALGNRTHSISWIPGQETTFYMVVPNENFSCIEQVQAFLVRPPRSSNPPTEIPIRLQRNPRGNNPKEFKATFTLGCQDSSLESASLFLYYLYRDTKGEQQISALTYLTVFEEAPSKVCAP